MSPFAPFLVSALLRRAAAALLAPALALACAAGAPPEPTETGRLVFWEVRSEAGGRAHLLGTVHVGRDPAAFDPAIAEALASADALVMEVDPAELDSELTVQLMLQKGLLDEGRSLRDVVSEETWALLEARLSERGIPLESFLYQEPWVVLVSLMGAALAEEGYAAAQGVEQRLLAAAPAVPVLALESASFQLELLDSLPLDRQERLLRGFLEADAEAASAELERILAAWRMGDLQALEALGMPGRGQDEDVDALYEVLYAERNRAMAERLSELLLRSSGRELFVMIGALHTVGEEGVPALLARRGFAVRRVPKTGWDGS